MKAVVTGAAGFIGSRLCERLVADGYDVVGVDAFTEYYDPEMKRANVSGLAGDARFELVEADLAHVDVASLLADVSVVFHQAGQPGVRLSWDDGFPVYVERNVTVTQRLLEGARRAGVERFVYASSSSIYGEVDRFPVTEDDLPRPFSPYGVTKLAAEHLCGLYAQNHGLSTVSLRYFTVYGPRQRPDMAMHRLMEAALGGPTFPMFGDGSQIRDFTFVDDAVAANMAAATADVAAGTVCNVAGGSSVSLSEVIGIVEELAGPVALDRQPAKAGDVSRTGGSTDRARELLGWKGTIDVREGLARQLDWHRSR